MPTFADTNVVVYAFGKDDVKVAIAEGILENQPTISVQVLNEFLSVCRVKLGMDIVTRHKLAGELIAGCNVLSLDLAVAEKAMQIEAQTQISYWDALIVAAALLSGCVRHALYGGPARRSGLRGPADYRQSVFAKAVRTREFSTTSDDVRFSRFRPASKPLRLLHVRVRRAEK